MSKKTDGIKQGNKVLDMLLDEVLVKIGMPRPRHSTDFELISETLISQKAKLGLTSIKRLWKYESHKGNFAISTLDILAKVVGHKSWNHYRQATSNNRDEFNKSVEQFFDAESDLQINYDVVLGNESQNFVRLKYTDFLTFEVVEYKGHGDYKVGDTIEARWFEVIEPNFKDHNNKECDIIALTGELESKTHNTSSDIEKYSRLYLSK